MSQGDPLTYSQEELLLKTVTTRIRETRQGEEVTALRSYYEVDELGRLKQFYEAYGTSHEDELYSCGYCVMDAMLWKFGMTQEVGCEAVLTLDAIFSELTAAPPPVRIAGAC